MIKIELICANNKKQVVLHMNMEDGSMIKEAIIQSKILYHYPELQLHNITTGIYGEKRELDYILEDNDRVEIYHPLLIDPKQARIDRVKRERRKK